MEGADEDATHDGGMLSQRVWHEVVRVLENTLTTAYHGGSGVKEALVLGYPRLAALLEATCTRILRDTDVRASF